MHAWGQIARLLRLVPVAIRVAGSSGDPCRNFANWRSTTTMSRLRLSGILLSTALCFGAATRPQLPKRRASIPADSREAIVGERDGWIYVHLEAAGRDRLSARRVAREGDRRLSARSSLSSNIRLGATGISIARPRRKCSGMPSTPNTGAR